MELSLLFASIKKSFREKPYERSDGVARMQTGLDWISSIEWTVLTNLKEKGLSRVPSNLERTSSFTHSK